MLLVMINVIKNSQNSPALFRFKVEENEDYWGGKKRKRGKKDQIFTTRSKSEAVMMNIT